jgi:hypothetical protein
VIARQFDRIDTWRTISFVLRRVWHPGGDERSGSVGVRLGSLARHALAANDRTGSVHIGMVTDTAAATFPLELTNIRANFLNALILFQWHAFCPTGSLLVGFAIAAAMISIPDRLHRTLRVFAITLLTYLGTRLSFAVLTIVFDFWRGPVTLYPEFFVRAADSQFGPICPF